jgi:hypothetical protein
MKSVRPVFVLSHVEICSSLKVASEESIHCLARHLKGSSVETNALLLDGIQHVQIASVSVTRYQLVTWWQCCEAQEHECSHQQSCKKIYLFNTGQLKVANGRVPTTHAKHANSTKDSATEVQFPCTDSSMKLQA